MTTRSGPAAPVWTWIPFALVAIVLLVPLAGLLAAAPLTRLPELLATDSAIDALRLSLLTCLASTGVVILLGIPTALLLARSTGRWVTAARVAITLPMVLPPVVAGLALLTTFGRRGLLGQHLSVIGIEIGFTTIAVVLAQVFVALPFLVLSVEGALRSAADGFEEVATSLGSGPTRVFWRVTLPITAPSLVAGSALAFARALGEFGATLTFAGSLQGVTRTMPLEIYLVRETGTDVALALSVVLLALAAAVVGVAFLASRRRGG